MKKWLVVGGGVLLILVATALFYKRHSRYEVMSPKKGSVTEAIYGLGTVRSRKVYELKIGVMNSISRIFHREGDMVKEGELLLTFNEGQKFKAPFTGTMTALNFNEGETVPPQVSVLRMEDLGVLYIEVSLEQEGALRVAPGQPVKVLFESVRGEVLSGKVTTLFPRNDEFIAQIDVENLSEKILPGMTADVTIEVGKIDGATLIPVVSVSNGMVNVRRGGKRQKVKVEIGHVDGQWAEILNNSIDLSDEVLVYAKDRK